MIHVTKCRVEVPRNCGTKRWLIGIEGSAVKICNAKNTLYTIGKSRGKNYILL